MNSRKITDQNHSSELRNVAGAAIVRGRFYNELKDDFDALRPSDTSLKSDTISEVTSGAGVTIDDVVLQDGGISLSAGIVQFSKTVSISAAEIIAVTAGGLGHANGLVLVAGLGTEYVLDLVSAVLVYDGDGTAYTDGGNVTINYGGGGAAITGLVSAANSFGATGDKIYRFVPLSTAALSLPVNTSLNLVSSAAFTTAGAAGTAIVRITYNVITTGL